MKIKGTRISANMFALICLSILTGCIPGLALAQNQYQVAAPSVPPTANPPSSTLPGVSSGTSTPKAQQTKPKICGDKPTCEITVTSGADFMKYAGMCHDLEGATVKWKASPYIVLSIKSDKEAYCSLRVDNSLDPNNPTVKYCTFNREQIAGMMTPEVKKALQAYEKDGSKVDNLKALTQPLLDCIGPLPTLDKTTNFTNIPISGTPGSTQIPSNQ